MQDKCMKSRYTLHKSQEDVEEELKIVAQIADLV